MKMLSKWKPVDVISLVLVIVCSVMLIMGIDSTVKYILLAVVGLYYGIDLTPFIKLGRNIKRKEED